MVRIGRYVATYEFNDLWASNIACLFDQNPRAWSFRFFAPSKSVVTVFQAVLTKGLFIKIELKLSLELIAILIQTIEQNFLPNAPSLLSQSTTFMG